MLKRAEKRDLKIYLDSKDTAGVCKRTRSRSFDVSEIGVDLCFFCGHPGGSAELHEASTLELDRRVSKSAAIIEDTRLLGKLSNGDMIALECKYHAKCLAALYNKEREAEKFKETESDQEQVFSGLAFAELPMYIEEHAFRKMLHQSSNYMIERISIMVFK